MGRIDGEVCEISGEGWELLGGASCACSEGEEGEVPWLDGELFNLYGEEKDMEWAAKGMYRLAAGSAHQGRRNGRPRDAMNMVFAIAKLLLAL